ncbi:hypothetical protein P148_SR1C00001G0833 [candidate division SR1 bacterium RAAC1_SR1_1]|nr:hypothetical protein P148_SR1C00001G0833 [candidate division SR1 bacterium RAAC1_SR1_1]
MKKFLGKLLGREKIGGKNISKEQQETLDRIGGFMEKLSDGSRVMKSYEQETKTTDFGLTEFLDGKLFSRLGENGFILTSHDTFYILDYINRAKKMALEQMTNNDDSTKISGVKFEYDQKFPENGPSIVVGIENVFDDDEDLGDEYEAGYGKSVPIINDKILNKIPEGKVIKEHANAIITYLNKWAMNNKIYDMPIAKDFI